jgi:hypothetical protein
MDTIRRAEHLSWQTSSHKQGDRANNGANDAKAAVPVALHKRRNPDGEAR